VKRIERGEREREKNTQNLKFIVAIIVAGKIE
jgi:hypothetical protein